jgi:hypothetical protein
MPNTYTLLETITVGAAEAASVTFNSIPQTGYTDLIVRASTRRASGGADNFLITFNGVTTGYTYRELTGNGSAASSSSGSLAITGLVDGATMTASTFSNNDIYIPNYTSSNFKSFTSDAVTENNLTLSYAQLWANLWSNTAAISSIKLQILGGNPFSEHSTFQLYGVSALGTTPTKAPKATGGSIIQTDGTYWYHAFLSSGTFTPATALSCDVLVVAGGGGGGTNIYHNCGGGGAGGVLSFTSQSLTNGTGYTTTIGAAGAANANGGNSTFGSLTTCVGGGRGSGGYVLVDGTAGGSGGGGGGGSVASLGGAATSGQGYAGGTGQSGSGAGYSAGAGGGGGAGAIGGAGTNTAGGNGGAGLNTWSSWLSTTGLGVSGYIAGGGGGAVGGGGGSSTGGAGGGGTGVPYNGTGTTGTANTGSGGGSQAAGGSGLIIVRYLAA